MRAEHLQASRTPSRDPGATGATPFLSFPQEQTDAFTPVGHNQPENNIKALIQEKKS